MDLMHSHKVEFNIGEEVVDVYGNKGKIVGICECDECQLKGFNEPIIETDSIYDPIYVTKEDKENNYKKLIKVGDRILHGNIKEEHIIWMKNQIIINKLKINNIRLAKSKKE